MNDKKSLISELYSNTDTDANVLQDPEVAHVVLNANRALAKHAVPGLNVDVKELEDGVDIKIRVEDNVQIKKTVHMCFGMIPEQGVQRIIMNIHVGKNSKISILAHCIFPNAIDVQHIMNAEITVDNGGEYTYFEKHVHSPEGGVKVYPKATVYVNAYARFKTEFELIKGRVGLIDIDYETIGGEKSTTEMTARISGIEDDVIKVKESGILKGEYARGVLTSKIAVRDRARAEVFNKLKATAAYARGHVDCKEIVQDNGIALATPIVEVNHPKAHITHEAAIGSVDTKQLETLMSRGLTEEEAIEVIIQGLLR